MYASRITQIKKEKYRDIIKQALQEDAIENDITSKALIQPSHRRGVARIISKEKGILAGGFIVKEVFLNIDPSCKTEQFIEEGRAFKKGSTIFRLEGKLLPILQGERVALNLLSFMSGISTQTAEIKKKLLRIGNSKVQILDTRKTISGMRLLSKYAVSMGGGSNHRQNLSDMGLIKDNHIQACGDILAAVSAFSQKNPLREYQIEIANLRDLKKILEHIREYRIRNILLDNMARPALQQAVKMIRGKEKKSGQKINIEVSGGYEIDNLQDLKGINIDFVSMGCLTMKIQNIDFSLMISS